jgi:hypothetical protein
MELGRLAVEIVNAGRRWAAARGKCRRLLDSKKASQHEVVAAQKVYVKASDELEILVRKLEGSMQLNGIVVPRNRRARGKPFPWRPLISMAADITKALETAVNNPGGGGAPADKPIDVPVEVIDATPPKGE